MLSGHWSNITIKIPVVSLVMINTSGSPPLAVTPKEYYRDYPDTVSITETDVTLNTNIS